ncbi:MAG: pitrilysin family protein [Bacteroidota bacterium]
MKKKSHFLLLCVTLCLLLAPLPQAKADPGDPVKVTSVEGITEYELDNGLRVLLFPDPSKQTVTVNVTYLVGSKHENYGETGMAHLLEHMVFKGTTNIPDVKEGITQRGNRWNGTTWYDRTNYFETLPATDENLEWAIMMEADRMVNSRVSREDLDSEMTVVRNEFEMGENSPFRMLMQGIVSSSYMWHNYGKSTIGARSDIENVPIDRLQAFYRKHYQPDNAVLTIAGKFEEEKTLEYIGKYFGVLPKPDRTLRTLYTQDPTQDGERSLTIRRVGDIKMAGVSYRVPAGTHEDYAGIDIISHILSSEPSGRLYKNLVDTKLATSVFGFNFQLEEPGVALFFTQTLKEADIYSVKNSMLATIDSLSINLPTDEEIERARASYVKQFEQSFNSSERICMQLSEWIGMGDWRMFFVHRDRVENISPDEVRRVAQYYFKPDNRTVGLFLPTEAPDRVEIPETPDVEAIVRNYKGREAIATGEAFDPSVENIESRTTRFQLPNGMQVAFLPKKTRGESVRMSMTLLSGDVNSLKGKTATSRLTSSMLNKGTTNMTQQEIKDKLDSLKSTLYLSGNNGYVMGTGETTRPNLVETVRMMAEILKEPTFPAEEFEKVKLEAISGIESQRSEPSAKASNALQRHANPYPVDDPRYVPTFDEQTERIQATTLEDVKAFHKDFYGASRGRICLVGDFDTDEMKVLLTELFGDWDSATPYKPIMNEMQDVPILNDNIEAPDKANAFFFALQEIPIEPEDEAYPALELGFYMLGSGFQSRLVKRIREKEGLSYGVGGNFSSHPIYKFGTFNAYAIYAPENRDKLESAFKEELTKVITEGFSEEEVTAAKDSWLKQRLVNQRAQDNFLARRLSLYMEWGRTMEWDALLEEKVSALSTEEINAAMKQYLDIEKVHMVKSGDFVKAGLAEN